METRRKRAKWCHYEVEFIVKEFNSNDSDGLQKDEVSERLDYYGANVFDTEEKISVFQKIYKQFKSPLVYILLIAGVMTLLLQEYIDTIVIFLALLINVVVGTFQEERASKAFEKLNASQEKFATVLRDNHRMRIKAEGVVPGDIIVVESGYHVPADIRLIKAKNLSINESALTGEWVGVQKDIATLKEDTPLSEQFNMAWMGTLVTSGYGRGIVIATGNDTEVGKIAKHLGRIEESATPLQRNVKKLARLLVYFVSFSIISIFVLGYLRGQPIADLLLMSIAIAVATIPEGLPAAVSIVLAIGMESILKRGGLVRNLLAAETLGATTIILTDKTGTLTEGKMKLTRLISYSSIGVRKKEGDDLLSDERELLKSVVLASKSFIEEVGKGSSQEIRVHGGPIETAIAIYGLEHGLSKRELEIENKRLDLLNFESKRRLGGSINILPRSKKNRLYVSGAPEMLIDSATHIYVDGKKVLFTQAKKKQFKSAQLRSSREGKRLIGVGYKDVDWDTIPVRWEENKPDPLTENLVFAGLIVFSDPPREDVPKAIAIVKRAGARVIMLTGDNPETAKTIAVAVGIAREDGDVLRGSDIEELDDDELYQALKHVNVFARVLPEQKLRIARILKSKNEIVAMTGDGINDAPALRSANIGIAVGSGTEVAKEASDMVLINDNFSVIVYAIEEGRKIIDNLKKIVAYLLSTSFSEIFLIGAALAAGAALPLLPSQILWANIVGEGLMSFSFAFEKPEKGIMERDPRSSRTKNILTHETKILIITISLVTGIFLVALYFILLQLNLPIEEVRTFMFAALSIASIFFAFSLKSFRKPIWKINLFDNTYLLVALGISILLLVGALTLGPLQTLLSLVPLSSFEYLVLLGIGFFNLITIELVKYFLFERKHS